MDLCLQFHKEVIEEAHKHRVPTGLVTTVFMRSYEVHKKKHGSFNPSHLPAEERHHYQAKMHERYRFQRDRAMEFITQYHHLSEEEKDKYLGRGKGTNGGTERVIT